jgi:biotin carboxylase
MNDQKKDIVLFVNAIRSITYEAIEEYTKRTAHNITPVIIVDEKIKDNIYKQNSQNYKDKGLLEIVADFDSPESIKAAIAPYKDRILAVTSQYENSVHELIKLVPNVPFLPTPTPESLKAATEKKLMRDKININDQDINPAYILITDDSEQTIEDIEAAVPYPLIVKPSGLEGSLLVALVSDREELVKTLKNTFKEIKNAYDMWIKRNTPAILIEEFMDGDMYSIDTYISSDGVFYHTPAVRVLTGRNVGFEDFFGYMQISPAALATEEVKKAQKCVERACNALGLRSVTAHVELMCVKGKWKIIEIGPRIGGYRHNLYSNSYDINHIMNDILIRADMLPVIDHTPKGFTTLLKLYAKNEGTLTAIEGQEIMEGVESFVSTKQDIKVGEQVRFAKNNGDPVYETILFNEDYIRLEEDIRRIEDSLIMEVDPLDKTVTSVTVKRRDFR